jgi:hypothetical protein
MKTQNDNNATIFIAHVYERNERGSWTLKKGRQYKSLSSARKAMLTWGSKYIGMSYRKVVDARYGLAHQISDEMLTEVIASSKGF